MKLKDFDATFVGHASEGRFRHGVPFDEAQGIFFECPRCPSGHGVLVWFDGRDVPAAMTPTPRWKMSGTGLDDLTLQPSILLAQPCGWHGFITNGEIVGA